MARLGTDGNWYVVKKGYSSSSAFREGIINKS
jgi:hypothetical protein